MVSRSALLRNIRPSGGLFTENIILRLRDNPDLLKIGKIESFLEKDTKELKKNFKEKRNIIFDWCTQKWDEISPNIENWSLDDLSKKWLIPLFTLFGHDLEIFQINKENIDDNSPLRDFKISHRSKDHKNPFFHFVNINEDFDSKIEHNPQGKSHHNTCQQLINLNPEIKWLLLSNGRILRILTKYYHSYSKGYIEFDLENIFANRDVKEFNVLYSIIHSTRFTERPKDYEILIDLFQKESVSEGIKIGDALRDNVKKALELLGKELIQQNLDFLDKILSGEIDRTEFYAELLRIIYRIIFILYAEQRHMLPGAGTLYFEQFSLSSLRFLVEKPIKAEKNYDLWNKLFITFNIVNEGNEFLDVNSYNGSLFKNENLPIILKNTLKVSNSVLLKIIRSLTTSVVINVRQRINFLEITEEEIGAIYESLLDYKPYISANAQFQLIEGTERKSTGSYYTPKALIDILIRTTLQPLVEDRLNEAGDNKKDREETILNLKICDPACGGGTFLLAALDFLGKKLAEIKTDSISPSEDDLRESRRQILQHCIYGVDMNPLAVELAKISLWLRACVKDKPLNFLDNHIKCGNSLIGLGQKKEIININPNAFTAISGNNTTGISPENGTLQNRARQIIRREINERNRQGKPLLITSFFTEKKTADICSIKFQEIIDMPENEPHTLLEKELKYKELRNNPSYLQALNDANIWTSTFFWSFEGNILGEIPRYSTITQLRNKFADPELEKLMKKIIKIAKENQFFHWDIEFPEVFSNIRGGFDCILANPPWEALSLQEREFFMGVDDDIFNASKQSERRKLIKSLKSKNIELFDKYQQEWRRMKRFSNFLIKSNLYKLSAKGTINTYALFIERCEKLISPQGRCGLIVPTAFITSYHLQELFKYLIKSKKISSLFDFQNRKMIFQIATRFRFCLLTISGMENIQAEVPMSFYSFYPQEIQKVLEDISLYKEKVKIERDSKLISFKSSDFNLFNPNTMTAPVFFSQRDYLITKHVYNQTKILIQRNAEDSSIKTNLWEINFNRMIDMSNDSNLFLTKEELEKILAKPVSSIGGTWKDKEGHNYFPAYEGKMIWLYDHRYNSVILSTTGFQHASSKVKLKEYNDPNFSAIPYYWIRDTEINERIPNYYIYNWFLVFRSISNAADEKTLISTIIPKFAVLNSLIIILTRKSASEICCLLANLNSIILGYIIKQKLSGWNLNFYIIEQLPVFPPNKYNNLLKKKIKKRVLELVYTSNSLKNFAHDCGYKREPYGWNIVRRLKIQSELDAIFALLYKINKQDLEYILDFFNVMKSREIEKYGEYKTKKLVLEAYDRFTKQMELFE